MKKTYLDRIGVGLEDARLLLGTGLTELFYFKISKTTETGDDKPGQASQTVSEKDDSTDLGTNQTDTAEEHGFVFHFLNDPRV